MTAISVEISERFLPHRDVLFVDIDDTITRFRNAPPQEGNGAFLGQSLFWLMCKDSDRQGMPVALAQRVVRGVYESMRWWDWADFCVALDLNPAQYWQMA